MGAKKAASCAKKNVPGGEWRTYGHDYSNSRFQPEEKEIGPSDATLLTPAWTFSTPDAGGDGDITGTPIVAYGCVYTGTNGGYVFAINADTGEVVWKRKVPYGGNIFGSALATKKRVFVIVNRTNPAEDCAKGQPCVGPYAMAVDRRTGKIDWTSKVLDEQPGADTYGSPVVFKGVMMAGVSGGIAELSSEAEHRMSVSRQAGRWTICRSVSAIGRLAISRARRDSSALPRGQCCMSPTRPPSASRVPNALSP